MTIDVISATCIRGRANSGVNAEDMKPNGICILQALVAHLLASNSVSLPLVISLCLVGFGNEALWIFSLMFGRVSSVLYVSIVVDYCIIFIVLFCARVQRPVAWRVYCICLMYLPVISSASSLFVNIQCLGIQCLGALYLSIVFAYSIFRIFLGIFYIWDFSIGTFNTALYIT